MNPDYSDVGDTGDCVESVPVLCALLASLPTARSWLREHWPEAQADALQLGAQTCAARARCPGISFTTFIKCLGRMGTKLRALPLEPRALVLPWQQLTVTAEGMRAGA